MASSSPPNHSFLYSRHFSRSRTPRNANPYGASPPQTSPRAESSALALTEQTTLEPDEEWDLNQGNVEQDDGEDEEEDDDGNEDDDDDDEREEDGEEGAEDIEEVEAEGPDEEGAIEEGAVRQNCPWHNMSAYEGDAIRELVLFIGDEGVQPRRSRRRDHQRSSFTYEAIPRENWHAHYGRMLNPAAAMDVDPPLDLTGLKEIGNLASWTVSTYKPGCGIEALRDEDTNLFWQSDGPQPHRLNIHFVRLVEIRAIRLFLDFEADESYTPTRITFLAGTGYHDLIEFSTLEFAQPKGWINVSLDGVGGGPDGNTLRAFLVQVKVVENHQNGKDTHLRALKIYAKDDQAEKGGMGQVDVALGKVDRLWPGTRDRWKKDVPAADMLSEPDWMGGAELR